MLLIFVVGDILGAGIYALVGEVGAKTGGAIWAAFMAALLLATLTAASYVELAGKYPRAAGAALYVNNAFHISFLTFMVAFAVMASGIASAGTLSRAFAGDYLKEFADLPTVVAAVAFLLVLAAINLRGIELSVKLNFALTAVEVAGLVLIVVIGVVALWKGQGDLGRNLEFKRGESVPLAIVGGAALAFYALIGFEDSVNVAEEVKDPSRAYPVALFGGLAIAGLIYLLVTVTASMVVDTRQLSASTGPLLDVVREGPLGIPLKLFSFIALLAVANGALINLIMASRLVYGMAEQGIVPSAFGRVLHRRQTPAVAIAFTTLLAIALTATGDLGALADTTVVLLLAVFVTVNVSVLVLRRDRVEHDHFRTPAPLPVLGALAALLLLAHKVSDNPPVVLRSGVLLLAGTGLWLVNRTVIKSQEH
jgi:APA family basic amino acid/polyamine antiporter